MDVISLNYRKKTDKNISAIQTNSENVCIDLENRENTDSDS